MKNSNVKKKIELLDKKSFVVWFILSLFFSYTSYAQQIIESGDHFDIRTSLFGNPAIAPSLEQNQAIQDFINQHPNFAVTINPSNGTIQKISNPTGYLTDPQEGAPNEIALEYIRQHASMIGITSSDVTSLVHTGSMEKRNGGSVQYFSQVVNGIRAHGQAQIMISAKGNILGITSHFIPGLADQQMTNAPSISAQDAVFSAAQQLGLVAESSITQVLSAEVSGSQITRMVSTFSLEPIDANLMYMEISKDNIILVWKFQLHPPNEEGTEIYVSAGPMLTGNVVYMHGLVAHANFRVYAQPVESPLDTSPLPPNDARTLVVNPEDPLASPNGWIDNTIMDGNNVHACADGNGNNVCDSGEPSCSGSPLTCSFNLNLSADPNNSIPASITNAFYWSNLIHDTQYKYGFTESAGNFQESNFGRGGLGSDSVNVFVQDGDGNCNANFSFNTDGNNSRMQVFNCNRSNPDRDGALDNALIIHEYGHGISIRQVGGPASICLNNNQQAGEGWSDFFALVYTAESSDQGEDPRGMFEWSFVSDSGGIRDLPYSTNPAINNWTYEDIRNAVIPHGVGSRWAQALWKVYWALVDKYGFDPDLLNPGNFDAGNQRALLYVNEGLQNTGCTPTFIDNRDGVIQAAIDNFGGEDVCTLWHTFAEFGLGTNASTVGPNSRQATNGFNVPTACDGAAPSNLSATANGNNINLTWQDNSTGEDFFQIQRSLNGGNFNVVGQVNIGVTTFDDNDLNPGLYTYRIRVSLDNVFSDFSNTASAVIGGGDIIIDANFDQNANGFAYADDVFRNTNQPAYASGVRLPAGGLSGGGLQVTLGGIDDVDIFNMSGGWERTFTLNSETDITLSFNYNLTQNPDYESDENSQALVSIDGNLLGPNGIVDAVVGDGNGGGPISTGWQFFQTNLLLSAGTHTLSLGGFNDQKTFNNEATEVLIDNVLVIGEGGSPSGVEIIGAWIAGTSHSAEPGSNRALIVTAHAEHEGVLSLNGMSYGGQAMAFVDDEIITTSGFSAYTAVFILDEAGIANAIGNTLVPNWSVTPSRTPGFSSVFLSGVDQSNLFGATATNSSTSATVSTNALPSSNGELVILAATVGNTGSYTVNNDFTEALELTITSTDGVAGHQAGGGSITPSVTHTNANRQSIVGVVITAN